MKRVYVDHHPIIIRMVHLRSSNPSTPQGWWSLSRWTVWFVQTFFHLWTVWHHISWSICKMLFVGPGLDLGSKQVAHRLVPTLIGLLFLSQRCVAGLDPLAWGEKLCFRGAEGLAYPCRQRQGWPISRHCPSTYSLHIVFYEGQSIRTSSRVLRSGFQALWCFQGAQLETCFFLSLQSLWSPFELQDPLAVPYFKTQLAIDALGPCIWSPRGPR